MVLDTVLDFCRMVKLRFTGNDLNFLMFPVLQQLVSGKVNEKIGRIINLI
jgi:hypothetical protein